MEWGVGPGGGVPHRGGCPAGTSIAGHILEGTLPGSVRSQGRVTVRDPELGRTCSARRDAPGIRIGNTGALYGLAVAPGQSVVSYVGYPRKGALR